MTQDAINNAGKQLIELLSFWCLIFKIFNRWCGQGGNILLCDNCTSSLCEGCLFKNLGRKYLRDAKTTDNWKCLLCDPSPILKHR